MNLFTIHIQCPTSRLASSSTIETLYKSCVIQLKCRQNCDKIRSVPLLPLLVLLHALDMSLVLQKYFLIEIYILWASPGTIITTTRHDPICYLNCYLFILGNLCCLIYCYSSLSCFVLHVCMLVSFPHLDGPKPSNFIQDNGWMWINDYLGHLYLFIYQPTTILDWVFAAGYTTRSYLYGTTCVRLMWFSCLRRQTLFKCL